MVQLEDLMDLIDHEACQDIKSIEQVASESPRPGNYVMWSYLENRIIQENIAPSLSAYLLYEHQFNGKSLKEISDELNVKIPGLFRKLKVPTLFKLFKKLKVPKRTKLEAFSGENHHFYGITRENNPNYGRVCSKKTKRKISKANRGKYRSEETKRKMSEAKRGEKHPLYGTHHSEETRKRMSEALSGEKGPQYGKPLLEETRRKISEAMKGENHYLYGKHPSEETRRKMSEAKRGEKHPNFNGWSSLESYTWLFSKIMRKYIRERDNYECQTCGILEDEKNHHIHHIDYDKKNDSEFNLITLCHSCHTSVPKGLRNEDKGVWQQIFFDAVRNIYENLSDDGLRALGKYQRGLRER
jgi:5-methylcytosine-specific restriction endonuclease McrA